MGNIKGNSGKNRVLWIDCAKTMAMLAVLVDHSYGVFYTNSWIATSSYFSVVVFVILSGMTQNMVMNNRKTISGGGQWTRILKLIRDYAIAVFILQCFYSGKFDLKTYISYLLNFNIQGPYYFLVFFIQLVAISPLLIQWNRYCGVRRRTVLYHLVTFVTLGIIAAIAINYTYILPVHGGGQYLFGGTFLLLYYLGIALEGNKLFQIESKKILCVLSVILILVWCTWIVLMHNGVLLFDKWMERYWGAGFNPPSVQSIVYGIISLFLFYAMFSFLQKSDNRIVNHLLKGIAWFGRYTLYIFMYHLVVRDMFIRYMPWITKNMIIYRVVFIAMFIIPAIVAYIIQKICQKWKVMGRSQQYNENYAEQIR